MNISDDTQRSTSIIEQLVVMVGLVNAFVNKHLTNVEAIKLCELKVMSSWL